MRKLIVFVVFLLFAGAMLSAQEQEAGAYIQYYENFSGEMRYVTAEQEEWYADVDFIIGDEIPAGATLITGSGDIAELELAPTQSIIKVSQETNFTVTSVQGAGGADQSSFKVTVGKFRAVVGRVTGDEKYSFQSPSAVCGVRGTDMGMNVPIGGGKEEAFVLDGLIDYTNGAGETIPLSTGQMADALSDTFAAIEIPSAYMASLMEELGFEALDPTAVPGHEVTVGAEAPEEPAAEEPVAEAAPAVIEEIPEEEVAEEAPAAPEEPGMFDEMFETLKEILGMEIGSVTIGGKTYSKAVLQPNLNLGKLRLGLYLPIIYQNDMFNPDDWYHPAGNNEWSFGMDQTGYLDMGLDFVSDLVLKIRYLGWGSLGDPLFFTVGNIPGMSLGHGMIVRNYANDIDFPSVRRVGLNAGVDFGFIGVEGLVNDVAKPEVIGGRFYVRPLASVFPLAIGLSAVTDIAPSGTLLDPMLIHGGVDLDLPIIRADFLKIIAFTDLISVYPFYGPESTTQSPIPDDKLMDYFVKNNAFAAGVFGNILMIDYRVEVRKYSGVVEPAYYNKLYDRNRADNLTDLLGALSTWETATTSLIGVYGEGGFKIEKLMSFEFGYMWPWEFDDVTGEIKMGAKDFLHAEAGLERGVVPMFDVWGSFAYDRSEIFTPLVRGDTTTLELIDENTILSIELLYGVAPTLDIAVLVKSNVTTDPVTGLKSVSVTPTVETRLHF